MIRAVVAEDSLTTRELLVEILRSDPELEVIGEAKNGVEAVEITKRLRPNVVTMDIRMPVMNGFEATKRIMIEAPTPIVIVSGSVDVREVETSMHALRAGALDVIQKPMGPGSADFEGISRRFVSTVKGMSRVKVVRHFPERPSAAPPAAALPARNGARCRIVAIASSTGGPEAVYRVLSCLPGDFPVPILVAQHVAAGFVQGLATWLSAGCAFRVKVAEDGEPLLARTVYLAPDDRHLEVSDRATIKTSIAAPIGGFRPSATALFESVARTFGSSAVVLILTGMGQDGVDGLRAVRSAGGRIIAQDEESSVVFGMPGAAIAAGLADAVLPLAAIASWLAEMV